MSTPGLELEAVRAAAAEESSWWRTAVVYQVYLRSFSDGDGDGVGDIAGLRDRIDHIARLGVDALWVNPWYPSPQVDAGYDVADYRDIDPSYGTLEEADALIKESHAAGVRVLLDIVPNHTSSAHRWFQSALAGDPAARARYIFRPGRGPGGDSPPNDWISNFGGPAWTRVEDGDWYLHLFASEQPDLDWSNPEVVAEFDDILRFWFDRGIDGFRIDVAHGLAKAAGLPDAGTPPTGAQHNFAHPAWDQDEVHDIYRRWRTVADSYDPPRTFVAESWVPSLDRLARYVRPDELHTAFEFDFLRSPFDAAAMRAVVTDSLRGAEQTGAPTTWVLGNHDVPRQVTRYARSQPSFPVEAAWDRLRWGQEPADLDRGLARARAAALVMLALPGTVYLYQGEELGLPEVEDLPDDRRQDPIWPMGGFTDPGRDGCRVPLPWEAGGPTCGFSPADATVEPWLPQPAGWDAYAAAAQESGPGSTLSLYREALRLRNEHLRGPHEVEWLDAPDGVLAFARGRLQCWLNTSDAPVGLPVGQQVLSSVTVTPAAHDVGGALVPDSAVWVVT